MQNSLLMAPRKLIGLVIALALIAAGAVMVIVSLLPDTEMHLGQLFLTGPLLLAVGSYWIYEDFIEPD